MNRRTFIKSVGGGVVACAGGEMFLQGTDEDEDDERETADADDVTTFNQASDPDVRQA